jgi:hypothetical protein
MARNQWKGKEVCNTINCTIKQDKGVLTKVNIATESHPDRKVENGIACAASIKTVLFALNPVVIRMSKTSNHKAAQW